MKSLFFVTLKLLHWVKDRTSETEEKKHVIGENLTEAEALSADLQELEARLKVCITCVCVVRIGRHNIFMLFNSVMKGSSFFIKGEQLYERCDLEHICL